jgi:hypothetical protein
LRALSLSELLVLLEVLEVFARVAMNASIDNYVK